MTGMHRVFYVDEILRKILESIDDPNTLLSPALSCQLLCEPALDILWRCQGSIAPLLNIIPQEIRLQFESERSKSFARALRPRALVRFDAYARRIQYLLVQEALPPMFAAIAAAHLKHTKHVLLPNIRELLWTTEDIQSLSYCHTLIGPKLSQFAIQQSGLPEIQKLAVRILNKLPATTKNILLIGVDVTSALFRFNDLRLFKCTTPCTMELLQHLSLLPSLHSINVYLDTPDFGPDFAANDRPIFPALRVAGIYVPDLSVITRFLKVVKHCMMEDLQVQTTNLFNADGMTSFIRQLHDTVGHSTLARLIVSSAVAQDSPDLVDTNTLQLLSDFRRIEILSFHSCYTCFDLDDSVVDQLARSWPRLRHLTIGSEQLAGWTPRLTLRGLESFAKHCPDLDYLRVDFDGREVVYPNQDGVVPRCALKDLRVGYSPIDDPDQVRACLMSIFHRLRNVHPAYSRTQSEDYDKWVEIGEDLRAINSFYPFDTDALLSSEYRMHC